MGYSNKVCIRLFSNISPCHWLKHVPQLKCARKRLQTDIRDLKAPLPEYLQETIELCEGCRHYAPVGLYLIEKGLMHWKLCKVALWIVQARCKKGIVFINITHFLTQPAQSYMCSLIYLNHIWCRFPLLIPELILNQSLPFKTYPYP